MGPTVQSNAECGKEMKKRGQAGWSGWKRMSEGNYDEGNSETSNIVDGLETVALTKRQEAEPMVTGLKMLRFSFGVMVSDDDEHTRRTA